MAVAPIYVDAPAIQPLRYTLLDSVSLIKDSDPHAGFGVQYESEFCGPARSTIAACVPVPPPTATVDVDVDIASQATISSTDTPAGDYEIDWGDGTVVTAIGSPDAASHTYSSNGTYVVTVDGPDGFVATGEITVTDGVASGPFSLAVRYDKEADDGISVVVGEPIPVYHLFQCRTVGAWSEGSARASRSLDLGASRVVAQAFQSLILSDPDLVDLTTGTAETLVDGLAALEQYAAENYGGTPVIHMSRADALRLVTLDAVYRVGDHLETGLGSLVVADGGYDSNLGPTAGAATEGYLLATGQVTVRESDTIVTDPQMKIPEDNEFVALAERTYVPTYECFAAAALVTESA